MENQEDKQHNLLKFITYLDHESPTGGTSSSILKLTVQRSKTWTLNKRLASTAGARLKCYLMIKHWESVKDRNQITHIAAGLKQDDMWALMNLILVGDGG